MERIKNILVCPLDWGLGHATRMVPVIEMLVQKGANVIIAADNRPLDFLLQRFPQNTFVRLKGYSPNYPSNSNMAWAILKSMPEMMSEANKANKMLQEIIREYHIDAVISDNRYELSTSKVPSVFITHQLDIQVKGWQTIGKPIINRLINHYVNKFDEVWIPDVLDKFRLSGKLSESNKFSNKSFNIGLLSRFLVPELKYEKNQIDILIILSGPEPQRTILEELLLSQALKTNLKTVILQGKPAEHINKEVNNVKIISHLPDTEFSELIQSARLVISRPGYSTLMDLAVFNKKAVFIPTPGQTEQEYLANRLLVEGIAFSQNQNNFSLTDALNSLSQFKGLFLENKPELLESRINNLLNIC